MASKSRSEKAGMSRVRELLQSVAILAVQAQTEIDCGFDVQAVNTIEMIEGDMEKIATKLDNIAKARSDWLAGAGMPYKTRRV
jgi:hypothetical protein